jgi:signal peptidase II
MAFQVVWLRKHQNSLQISPDCELWQIWFGEAILWPMVEQTANNESTNNTQPETTRPAGGTTPARWGVLIGVGGLVIALDQTVKWLVTTKLQLGQSWEPIPAIGSFIKITYSYNSGAAFGMFANASDLFLLLALITIGAFIFSYPKLPSHAWLSRVSIGLISGGAFSNALDRLRMSHVVDYVHVQLTPTFSNISNLADHAITVGVILLLVDQWLAERRNASTAQPAPEETELTTPSISDKL